MTINGKPFLYRAGTHIDSLSLGSREYEKSPSTDIVIDLRSSGSLSVPVAHMNPLLVAIVERMFDEGTLTMEAAERINYLTGVVLQDPREALEVAMMEAGEDF